jgi:hypothetical protein
MKIKFSLLFLLVTCSTNALQFSKEELKNIQTFSKEFFESVRNGTISSNYKTTGIKLTRGKKENEQKGEEKKIKKKTVTSNIFI